MHTSINLINSYLSVSLLYHKLVGFSSEIFGLRRMWNNFLAEIVKYLTSFNVKWNSPLHICEANISQRSYFTWRSHISLAEGEFRWKKHTLSWQTNVCFFLAEKERFELSRRDNRPTPLAGAPLRPLEYFSVYSSQAAVCRNLRHRLLYTIFILLSSLFLSFFNLFLLPSFFMA